MPHLSYHRSSAGYYVQVTSGVTTDVSFSTGNAPSFVWLYYHSSAGCYVLHNVQVSQQTFPPAIPHQLYHHSFAGGRSMAALTWFVALTKRCENPVYIEKNGAGCNCSSLLQTDEQHPSWQIFLHLTSRQPEIFQAGKELGMPHQLDQMRTRKRTSHVNWQGLSERSWSVNVQTPDQTFLGRAIHF
jgi:hypothetical protein